MKDLKNILKEVASLKENKPMDFKEFDAAVLKLGAVHHKVLGYSRWVGEDGWDIMGKDKNIFFFSKSDWKKTEIVVMYKGTRYFDDYESAYEFIKGEKK